MKAIHLFVKALFAIAIIALISSCSSHEDDSLLPKPETPIEPEPEPTPDPDSPLEIVNGVLIRVKDGHEEITLPANVKRIQKEVFLGKEIRKVTLNEGLEVIEEDAFAASTLEEINFPSTLKEIGKYAFYRCEKLATVDLSRTKVTILPENIFGYAGLQSVVFPSTLVKIEAQAFLGTAQLGAIEVPASTTSIGNEAFRECGATTVRLPNNLAFIDQRGFYYCPNLQKVTTYGVITKDDSSATMSTSSFEGCPQISIFEIPSNMRRIEQGILGVNKEVKNITIPLNVNYMAFSAFGNTGIEEVIVEPTTPPAIQDFPAWYGFPKDVRSIKVPNGTVAQYKAAIGWNEFANVIQ